MKPASKLHDRHADHGSLAERIWRCLEQIADPEIPVISITDLGIVRAVEPGKDGVTIALAPTYSGCPATEIIEESVVAAIEDAGLGPVTLRRELSPPWTTDWISDRGREKLLACGIAPPAKGSASTTKPGTFRSNQPLACPHCGSDQTVRVSEFGSTACKAAYRCETCLEPFEYFKCI